MASVIASSSAAPAPKPTWRFRQPVTGPPGPWFHGLVALPTMVLLASVSLPGFDFALWLAGLSGLGVAAIIWTVRLAESLVRLRRHCRGGPPLPRHVGWLAAAPAGALLVAALMAFQVPLRGRWAASEPRFNAARATANCTPDAPCRLGLFTITNVDRYGPEQGDAIVFYEKHGAFFDDAGFAYLPHGTARVTGIGIWENPQFVHLNGSWYSWTARW